MLAPIKLKNPLLIDRDPVHRVIVDILHPLLGGYPRPDRRMQHPNPDRTFPPLATNWRQIILHISPVNHHLRKDERPTM